MLFPRAEGIRGQRDPYVKIECLNFGVESCFPRGFGQFASLGAWFWTKVMEGGEKFEGRGPLLGRRMMRLPTGQTAGNGVFHGGL